MPHTLLGEGMDIGITLALCLPVHMSCKCNSSLMDEPILMKLYTIAVYHMCMKEDNPGLKHFKGDKFKI